MGRLKLARNIPLWGAALLIYAFLLGPVVVVMIGALDATPAPYFRFPPHDFSLRMFGHIPPKYLFALGLSLTIAAVAASIATLLGAAAALALVRGRLFVRRSVLEGFFALPLQIPLVVSGVVFLQFYHRLADVSGVDLLGTFAGLLLAHIFLTLPYNVSAVAVVLMRANPRLEEAAESLGASPLSIFRRVTLPMMKSGLFAGFFYSFIVSFGDVPVSLFLSSGRFVTLPVEIFLALQVDFEQSILAVSTLVILISVALIVGMQRLIGLDLIMPSNRR